MTLRNKLQIKNTWFKFVKFYRDIFENSYMCNWQHSPQGNSDLTDINIDKT